MGLFGGLVGVVIFGIVYFIYNLFIFRIVDPITHEVNTRFLGLTGMAYLAINFISYPAFGAIGGAITGVMFQKANTVTTQQVTAIITR